MSRHIATPPRLRVFPGVGSENHAVYMEAFTDEDGVRHRAITYTADFRYLENGASIVEDFKGRETEVFKLKRKMFASRYPGHRFRITK